MSAIPQEFMGDLVETTLQVNVDSALGAIVLKTSRGNFLLGPDQANKLILSLIECGFRLARMESDDCPA
jgi:hypothetical protein